jgi:hypothetical protein
LEADGWLVKVLSGSIRRRHGHIMLELARGTRVM